MTHFPRVTWTTGHEQTEGMGAGKGCQKPGHRREEQTFQDSVLVRKSNVLKRSMLPPRQHFQLVLSQADMVLESIDAVFTEDETRSSKSVMEGRNRNFWKRNTTRR